MEDLIKFQAQQLNAVREENERLKTRNKYLEPRNEYLENEHKQIKQLLQELVKDLEVMDAEILEFPQLDQATKVFDEIFQNPIQQLNNLL